MRENLQFQLLHLNIFFDVVSLTMLLRNFLSSQADIFNVLNHLMFTHFLDILINYLLLHLLPCQTYPLYLSPTVNLPV
jgi:polysaccharide pyruvyl transferase WcaK-like protein